MFPFLFVVEFCFVTFFLFPFCAGFRFRLLCTFLFVCVDALSFVLIHGFFIEKENVSVDGYEALYCKQVRPLVRLVADRAQDGETLKQRRNTTKENNDEMLKICVVVVVLLIFFNIYFSSFFLCYFLFFFSLFFFFGQRYLLCVWRQDREQKNVRSFGRWQSWSSCRSAKRTPRRKDGKLYYLNEENNKSAFLFSVFFFSLFSFSFFAFCSPFLFLFVCLF